MQRLTASAASLGPMDCNNLYSGNLTARQCKRLIVKLFGRKRRCDTGVPRTDAGWLRQLHPPERAYRRVTWAEVRRPLSSAHHSALGVVGQESRVPVALRRGRRRARPSACRVGLRRMARPPIVPPKPEA